MAASATGITELVGGLDSDDTARARECLRSLGIVISENSDSWQISGNGGTWEPPATPLEVGESGLTARFLMALAGLVDGKVTIEGQGRIPERPMGALIEALGKLGVSVSSAHPWLIEGTGSIKGGRLEVDGSSTSQVVSALLLVAPMADENLKLIPTGRLVSSAYVDMTLELMGEFGVFPTPFETGWAVPRSPYRPTRLNIPIDASAMVYPAAAAAISGGFVEIYGDPGNHPDLAFLDAIAAMGCEVRRSGQMTTVAGPESLTGLDIDMSEAPDAAVALAVLGAVASGSSRIRGLGSLRLKESDRLAALQTELSKVGANIEVSGDSLDIEPTSAPKTARLNSHDDHRMAMSLALIGLVADGTEIEGSDSVAKTWPGFWDWFATLSPEIAKT